jgi:Ogr/Delta-like zinc finger
MVTPARDRFFVPCPHCGAASNSMKLQHVSRTTISLGYNCTNADCGHRFVAVAEAVRTLSPPAIPRPGVRLALDARIDRSGLAEALRTLPTAERLASDAPQGPAGSAPEPASAAPTDDLAKAGTVDTLPAAAAPGTSPPIPA